MPNNTFVTGPPGCGKSTVIERVSNILEDQGYLAGGVVSPEIRVNGERRGFRIVDIGRDVSRVMAHVQYEGSNVGKYGVDVGAVDSVCGEAFSYATDEADYVLVDEIAPMEVLSDEFTLGVEQVLDSRQPLVGAIHMQSSNSFITGVKEHRDNSICEVTPENRDKLPQELSEMVKDSLD